MSDCLEKIVSALDRETIVFGFPELVDGAIFNSAAVVGQNTLITSYKKQELPIMQYLMKKGIFPGDKAVLFKLKNINIGLSVCEDIWVDDQARKCAEAGADLICNINASPFHQGKHQERLLAVRKSVEHQASQ